MKKSALCLSILLLLSFQLSLTAFATDNTAPIGGLTPEEEKQTNEEIIQEVLNDPTISDEAKASVIEKITFVAKEKSQACRAPVYERVVTYYPKMQEDSTKCAPATIQQSLEVYNGYGCPLESQTTIQNKIGKAPGLSAVLDYLNKHQKKTVLVRKKVNSMEDIRGCIDWSYHHSCPIIFTFAADTTFWYYNTQGHFTNIAGYSYSNYLIIDPFYFVKYVPSSKGSEGRYWISGDKAWRANTMLFGVGNNTIGW